MRPCFFPTESFKGSTAKRPFTSWLVEVVDKEKGVDGKRASGWSWSYYRGKQLVRLFAEWISAGVITQSVAMSDARSTDPRQATTSKMRCAWAKPI